MVINDTKRMKQEDHEFEASLGYTLARHWWLLTVILTTQEAEIRKIAVQSQPGHII
jgi:hypothetical protein